MELQLVDHGELSQIYLCFRSLAFVPHCLPVIHLRGNWGYGSIVRYFNFRRLHSQMRKYTAFILDCMMLGLFISLFNF